jgi:hypothetical protein
MINWASSDQDKKYYQDLVAMNDLERVEFRAAYVDAGEQRAAMVRRISECEDRLMEWKERERRAWRARWY